MPLNASRLASYRTRAMACGPSAALGCLGVLMAHHPMLLSGLRRIQVDLCDTRFNHYVLEHAYRWSIRSPLHAEFWNPPFFYPTPNVAAYSDVLAGVAPIYATFRLLGNTPDTSYQLWMIGCSALNYLAALHLLRRRLRVRPTAAGVGAFLFAFGAPRVNQLGHAQLLPHFPSLVTIDALICLFEEPAGPARRRARLWFAAMLGVVTQLWTGFYLGYFLLLALALVGLLAPLRRPTRDACLAVLRRDAPWIASALLAGAALLLPLARHYLLSAREFGPRYVPTVRMFTADWTSLFYQGPESWLWGMPFRSGQIPPASWEGEKRLGIGLITPLGCALGLYWNRHRALVRLMAVASPLLVASVIPLNREFVLDLSFLAILVAVIVMFRERRARPRDHALMVLVIALDVALDRFHGDRILGVAIFILILVLADLARDRDDPRRAVLAGALVIPTTLVLFAPIVLGIGAGVGAALACVSWLLGVRQVSRVGAVGLGSMLLFACVMTYPGSPRPLAMASLAGLVTWWLHVAVPASRPGLSAGSLLPVLILGLILTSVYRGDDLGWMYLYRHLPGASALHAISRVGLMLLIPSAIGIALCLDALLLRQRRLLALGVGLIALVEQGVTTPSFDKGENRRHIASLARQVDRRDRAFFYSPRHEPLPFWRPHLDAMWAGLEAGVPTINGYSGNRPRRWEPLVYPVIRDEADERRLGAALARWVEQERLPRGEVDWVGGPTGWRRRAEPGTLFADEMPRIP